MSEHAKPNRLIDETSPYLLQHAFNPVAWYPWGEEALELARSENKPVLLSIGYSACHWCHVMAHESFEDEDTALTMNELFVNVKVDREERPDLDRIYQLAHQLLSRRPGGWPLTVFLNPHDQLPFFCGTYFPREPRYNLPGFRDLLSRVAEYYHREAHALKENGQALLQALNDFDAQSVAGGELGTQLAEELFVNIQTAFDAEHGGFSGAPKFPHITALEFLLRYWHGHPDTRQESLRMALTSMECMARGGLYDQLRGGFFRYSVDERWEIPHFEKMLYDNGPFLVLFSQAWQITRNPLFAKVIEETADWARTEMQSAEGPFYSSLDADSEGEEGRFYVWERHQLQTLLTAEEFNLMACLYGWNRVANFEGRWHLTQIASVSDCASQLGMQNVRAVELESSARSKLLTIRNQRVRPGLDDKQLTSWNALMIHGMTMAGRVMGRPDYVDSAQKAFDFIKQHSWHENRLYAVYKNGRCRFPAYLDDHAFLLLAGLELLQARWQKSVLDWLRQLADQLLAHFFDESSGGFFFTGNDHEALIHRPKPFTDDSMISGNAAVALALSRLGHVLGEMRYLDAAEKTLLSASPMMQRYPTAHAGMINALDEWLNSPQIIVLRGREEVMQDWLKESTTGYHPGRISLPIPVSEVDLPGVLAERRPIGEMVAYVCGKGRCLPPIHSKLEFDRVLASATNSVDVPSIDRPA